MGNWTLEGSFKTTSLSNNKEVLSTSPLDASGTYNEQVVHQGVVATGTGYEAVSLGPIASAKLVELRLGTAASIRLNGSSVFANCTRMILLADITQLEIARDAGTSISYWVNALGD